MLTHVCNTNTEVVDTYQSPVLFPDFVANRQNYRYS